MCICMSKSFYEKINLLLFVQYESQHVMVKIGFRMSKCDIRPEFECRKKKNEKRKTKSKLTSPFIEYRKTKNKPTLPCCFSQINCVCLDDAGARCADYISHSLTAKISDFFYLKYEWVPLKL